MVIEYPVAVISDIHSNLEALTVVLEDIDRRDVKQIICLGDIIGYGPNPRECLDLVMERCAWSLLGNHDFAAMFEPTNFNTGAEAAAFWTRRELELEPDKEKRARRWAYLGALRYRSTFDEYLCVHGSPRRPINEYIFADDAITAPVKMQQVFALIEHRCLVGHTHVPGVFTNEPDFYPPDELDYEYGFDRQEKIVINVGSVGQPRDRDPRSSYATLYPDRVEFHRLEYDIASVVKKVEAIGELNDFFGHRLIEGR